MVVLRVQKPWDHCAGSLDRIIGRDHWAGSLGGITGNVEAAEAMGQWGDDRAGSLVTLRVSKLSVILYFRGENPI